MRYGTYVSVTLVSLTVASFIATHAYVEYVSMRPARPLGAYNNGDDDDEEAEEDAGEWIAATESSLLLRGWGGGLSGGTDARLGTLARVAVRAAWLSLHWAGAGDREALAGAAEATSKVTAADESPFAVRKTGESDRRRATGGGAIIRARDGDGLGGGELGAQGSDGGAILSSSWLSTEAYLCYALESAESSRGITLANYDTDDVDSCALQLEARLADVRERIGGAHRLQLAAIAWARIHAALSAADATDAPLDIHGGDVSRALSKRRSTALREQIYAARKVGEITSRLAQLAPPANREQLTLDAKSWLQGAVLAALAPGEGVPFHASSSAGDVEQTKHTGPSTSFWAFWSRSHPPSSPATPTPTPPGDSELALVCARLRKPSLTTHDSKVLRPALTREVVRCAVALEALVAQSAAAAASGGASATSSERLANAMQVQDAAKAFIAGMCASTTLLMPSPGASLTRREGNVSALQSAMHRPGASQSSALHQLWLLSRHALLESHHAETRLALSTSSSSSSSSSSLQVTLKDVLNKDKGKAASEAARELEDSARQCANVLAALSSPPAPAASSPSPVSARQGRPERAPPSDDRQAGPHAPVPARGGNEELTTVRDKLERDARQTAALALRLLAHMHELVSGAPSPPASSSWLPELLSRAPTPPSWTKTRDMAQAQDKAASLYALGASMLTRHRANRQQAITSWSSPFGGRQKQKDDDEMDVVDSKLFAELEAGLARTTTTTSQ